MLLIPLRAQVFGTDNCAGSFRRIALAHGLPRDGGPQCCHQVNTLTGARALVAGGQGAPAPVTGLALTCARAGGAARLALRQL